MAVRGNTKRKTTDESQYSLAWFGKEWEIHLTPLTNLGKTSAWFDLVKALLRD